MSGGPHWGPLSDAGARADSDADGYADAAAGASGDGDGGADIVTYNDVARDGEAAAFAAADG